jgi:hypothetical protein
MPKGNTITKVEKKIVQEDSKKLKEKIKSAFHEIFSEEQKAIYEKSNERQIFWFEWFLRTGDLAEATRQTFPQAADPSQRVIGSKMQEHWKISMAKLFEIMGVTKPEIVTKPQVLLNAKRKITTFKKGDLIDEVEEEDNYAIGKGLDIAIKLTGNDPGQKFLHGEDPNNKFTSIADMLKGLKSNSSSLKNE